MSGISSLPPEMLERVFWMLRPKDRMLVVQVSKSWKNICDSSPRLWDWLHLTVDESNIMMLPQIVASTRMVGLNSLKVEVNMTQELLCVIRNWKMLKCLDFNNNNLSDVSPDLLSKTLREVESVILGSSIVTMDQVKALFISLGPASKVMELDVRDCDLSPVDSQLLTPLCNMLTLDLSHTNLNTAQLNTLFTAIGNGTRLVSLDVSRNDVSSVDPSLLRPLAGLTTIWIEQTNLTPLQLQFLFEAIGRERLERLNVSKNNLSSVLPQLLAPLRKLKYVSVCDTRLNTLQLRTLLSAIEEGSHLEFLDLSFNNLSSIESSLLIPLVKFETVHMVGTQVTPAHLSTLFSAIADAFLVLGKNLQIKSLDISCNNLSLVRSSLIITLTLLQSVEVLDSQLTSSQFQCLLSVIRGGGSSLKHLDISYNNLSSLDPSLMEGFKQLDFVRIREIDLV